jgi:hypothetical protein
MKSGTEGGGESEEELEQDLLLAVGYFLLSIFAVWRLIVYFSLTGGGKVITLFFFLITLTSLLRFLWFIIPSHVLEDTYTPMPLHAFHTNGWKGLFISELFLISGNLSLYGVFLLVICYWSHMLYKVENPDVIEINYVLPSSSATGSSSTASSSTSSQHKNKRRGPMETFGLMMFFLALMEFTNLLLFLFDFYNSELMILFDSLLFSLTSLATLIALTLFSSRIRIVLTMMGVINGNSTKPQVRRILAITVAANTFFVIRLVIEISTSLYLMTLWTGNIPILFHPSRLFSLLLSSLDSSSTQILLCDSLRSLLEQLYLL